MKKSILLSLLVFAVPAFVVAEEESPLALSASVGMYSDYMWRGYNLYDGTSVQPSVNADYETEYGTFSANIWFHLSAEGDRQDEKFTEMDDTLSYSYTLDPVTLKVGHVWYTYPDDKDEIVDSAEFFASVVLDDSGMNEFFSLSPTISVYQDYRATDAQYYELGLSHVFEPKFLGEDGNATAFVTFGFASHADKAYSRDSGLVQITYGLTTAVAMGDLELAPVVSYAQKVDEVTASELWFGFSLSF